MEGTKCSQPHCSVHDFLPFFCPKCEKMYCLDHRSRFSHDCINDSASQETQKGDEKVRGSNFSVKGMFQSLTERFKSDSPSPITHSQHAVHSSKPSSHGQDGRFNSSLQRLEQLSNSSENEKTKKISSKTREMLIKSRATGNDNCSVEDRIYLMIHFEPLILESSLLSEESTTQLEEVVTSVKASTNSIKYLFFSRFASLGEMLYQLKQQFADLIVFVAKRLESSLSRIEDIGVSVQTTDTPDWRQWNSLKNSPLHEVFSSFEEIWIKIVPLSQLLTLQLNPILNLQFQPTAATKPLRQSSELKSTASVASPVRTDSIDSSLKKEFKRGDRVWYYKDINAQDGAPAVFSSFLEAYEHRDSILLQLAEIVAIHHDDFPNIYYTINLLPATSVSTTSASSSLSGEKQTDNRHLLPYHPSEERILLDQQLDRFLQHYQQLGTQVLRLHIYYKNQEIAQLPLGDGTTIGQLRQLIGNYLLPQLSSANKAKMKLICKGTILKDDAVTLAKASKVGDGSKIMIMASE